MKNIFVLLMLLVLVACSNSSDGSVGNVNADAPVIGLPSTGAPSSEKPIDETPEPPIGEPEPPITTPVIFDKSKTITLSEVQTIENLEPSDVNIPTYNNGVNDIAFASLTAISDMVNTDKTAKQATLQGLAVQGNDTSIYERETVETLWDDTANLKIDREIQISRITPSIVDLTFDINGTISGAITYNDVEYDYNVTVDRSTVFDFTSNHMIYASWQLSEQADSSTELTETGYHQDGMVIAGIETDNKSIFTAGKVVFTGKGRGVYGSVADNALTRYHTSFGATANVDFTAGNVQFTTSGTACTGACDNITVPSYLNFNTGLIAYTGNNISKNLTLDNSLSGRFDARFYGGEAQEFGGTIALADDTENNERYYYGAFGATRNNVAPFVGSDTIVINAVEDIVAENPQAENLAGNDSLLAIANGNVTLQGLTVLLNDISDYERTTTDIAWATYANADLKIDRQITPTRITSSAVSLAFAGSNASVTTIYADDDYVTGATVDRNTIFGFDSDYMAYISWQLSEQADSLNELNETSYHKDGMMIAGIQTKDGDIFDAGKVAFNGKGSGVYGTKTATETTSFNTIFDVTAEIDFDAKTIGLTTDTNCTDCNAFDASTLNFTDLELSFANGNNISKTVTLDGTLAGTLDARFYGGETQEFGGAFALADVNTRYYYGIFGSTRHGITPFVGDDSTTLNALETVSAKTPQTETLGGNLSLSAIADGNVTLQGLAILIDDTTDYARYNTDTAWSDTANLTIDRQINPTRITSSFVALAFASNVASVTTIYADDDYTKDATADRSTIFGFDADYMTHISWDSEKTDLGDGVQDSIYNRNGVMIAGIQTKDVDIFGAGKAEFTGKGEGVYGSKTERFNTTFDVTAKIDFGKTIVDISTSDTACTGADCNSLLASALNLKNLSLSFAGGNSISEDLSADTPTGTLIGKLDARFYGGQAQEFGGTFALSEQNQRYYYGAFGTTRNGIAPFVIGSTTHINALSMAATNPQTENLDGNDSLSTIANGNVTLQGLTVLLNDETDYARYNTGTAWSDTANLKIVRNIAPTRITASAVDLAFDVNNIASATTIYADDNYSNATVDRSAIFGFNSDYMAYISWHLDETLDTNDGALTQTITDIDGMMIAGIQASDANIISSVGRVQFTGKGKGVYGTKTATEIIGYETIFDVTADVDFDVNNMDISISDTVCDGVCDNVTVPTYLDFSTGLITYTGNNISEIVTLDGTLAGTLDARFYGDDVAGPDEFGGTFALTETDTRYYYGAFGASRHGVAPFLAGDITRLNTLGAISAATIPQNIAYSDNTTISGKTATTLTLKTVAVLDDDTTTYKRYTDATAWNDPNPEQTLNLNRQINISRIDTPTPAVALTFDGSGDITAVRIYADKEYVTGDAGLTIDADNSNAVFGFNTNYMAYINWHLLKTTADLGILNEDNIYNRNGIMVGGIESSDAKLTSHNKVARFEGKGLGTYGSLDNGVLTEYETTFDVTAKAYFHNRTLNIDVSGTQCTGACNNISVPTYLDDIAITDASFANGNSASNNFSHALTLDNSLTGTLDARFYGKNNSIAKEFGGTFALAQADTRYYYGAFGAERLAEKTPPARAGFSTPYYDEYTYSTFHSNKKHNRIAVDFGGRYLLSYDNEDSFGISDLFTGTNYHDSLSAYITISKDDAFSFKPKYMAHIGWDMKQIISYDANNNIVHPDDSIRQIIERENGNQIVGFNTPNNKVFSKSKGDINFKGKGKGLLIINKTDIDHQEHHTSFDVIAAVNFSTRKVNLQMSNTADCSDNSAVATCNITTDSARLDSTNILSYSSGNNYISGQILVAGMPGTANARFFGKNDAEEFGGTFLAGATLSVDTNGYSAGDSLEYSGWFGTRRNWVFKDVANNVYEKGAYYDKPYAPLFIASNSGAEPQPNAIVSGGTFNRVSDYADSHNKNIVITLEDALFAEKRSGSSYTRATATDTWIASNAGRVLTQNDDIALAVSYSKTGHIVAAGAYFADGKKQYRSVSLDDQNNVTTSETSLTTDSDDNGGIYEHASIASASHSLQIVKRNDYMMTISWEIFNSSAPSVSSHLTEYQGGNIRGYAIAGFSTDDAHLRGKTGTASFTGEGVGNYQDDDVVGGSSIIISNVLAQVNFGSKQVDVRASTDRCRNGCLLDWPKVRFNYSATLTYDNNSGNMLTGVATIDESNPKSGELSGTAQARFYGPDAEEFGGTFEIRNADATITYHGSFFTKE